jgi:hypothetical protein
MSSDPMWKRDANGVEHPMPETLLAFMREQCAEHEKSRINEHLLTGCVPCSRVRAGLTLSSNALNQLKYMSRYLYYPELQSNQVLLHAQRGEPLTSVWTGKRKRKFQAQSRSQITRQYVYKKSVRIISLPVAFALLLIFMTAVLVLAYSVVNSGFRIPLPGQQSSGFIIPEPNTPVVAQHQPTPTNTVAGTITATPSVSAIVGVSPTPVGPTPTIGICPHPRFMYLEICGYGFKKGDKISLVLDYYGSKSPLVRNALVADSLGEFMNGWNIYSCHYLPIAIYAEDVSQKPGSVISNVLTSIQIQVSGCHGPTPTPMPGGGR